MMAKALRIRFAVATLVLALLMFGPLAIAGWLLWVMAETGERQVLAEVLGDHFSLIVMVLGLTFAVGCMGLHALFRSYMGRALALGEKVQLMLDANPGMRLVEEGPREFRAIARAANALAGQRDRLRCDVETQIASARKSIESERNRLAALMGELTQSVVVCNLDGRILLYNSRARQQFRALSDAPQAADGGELIGLGRSIYAIFDRSVVMHAMDTVAQRMRRGSGQAVASFVTTCGSGQLLRVQMSPVLSGAEEGDSARTMTGFILLLSDVTREFERESRRDRMLHSLTEGNRASLANVRAAAETLEFPDLDDDLRHRLHAVIRDEVAGMSTRLDETSGAFADAVRGRWPLEDMHGIDFVDVARQRVTQRLGVQVKAEDVDADAWITIDSYSLLQAVVYLGHRLVDAFDVRELRLRLLSAGRFAHLDLIWSGHAASNETLMPWELEPMVVGAESSPLTVRDVIDRHGGEIWLERDKTAHCMFFRMLLPAAAAQEPSTQTTGLLYAESRPEYYDFDIFSWSEMSRALDDHPLSELSYTVFDTETTGLDPSGGDEIIQIGATRIVNGKLLRRESFEQLVDPRRTMRPESIAIHGIQPEMLVGQPGIAGVLPAFHAFAAETVLVAHNAAFDMRFLQLKEALTGLRFDQPVLDTLLLSALLHPNQESHRLEAIAERLGVAIVGRHTALGDALVTAEVFIKMIPLLAERGIHTLGQVREASEQTYYARVRY